MRGRPRKSDEERTVHVTVRIPISVYRFYRKYPNFSSAIRGALEEHAKAHDPLDTV